MNAAIPTLHLKILWISLIPLLFVPQLGLSINYQEPGWEVKCEKDPFTGNSCYVVGKWGRYSMMGDPVVILNIYYVKSHDGIEAVFFTSNPNHYPAKPFMIKIDEQKPIIGLSKVEEEGTFMRQNFPQLFDQIRTGKIMLVRYYIWPDGIVDATIDLTGFQDAINKARSEIDKLK